MGVVEVWKPRGKVILMELPALYVVLRENCIWYVEDCPTTSVLSEVIRGKLDVAVVTTGAGGKTTFPKF